MKISPNPQSSHPITDGRAGSHLVSDGECLFLIFNSLIQLCPNPFLPLFLFLNLLYALDKPILSLIADLVDVENFQEDVSAVVAETSLMIQRLLQTFLSSSSLALKSKIFAQYTARTAFERPLLSGVAYAQRILNFEREGFERQHEWTIKTMEKEHSPVRDEYALVIFSQETVSYIESLDMMSGKEDRENILRAQATSKAVLTSLFRLLNSHHLGVILTFPVYNSNLPSNPTVKERIEATTG
ncbi:CHASE domain containing histidine kinase protein [Perilla frutescens var. hirtella]|nr:CHASE domain containing histidine kinase protein [Perilla frutescens var. frutescens]KAH6787393.1 CHASE domain containing histidine kinase protein [Perilla frutescens var. hirtella]